MGTFGNRQEKKLNSATPAPNAYNTSKLNPRGKDEPVAPTLHIKPKDPKTFVTPSPGAYNPVKVSLERTPEVAFGIKHSPYICQLKGDEWVSARTEVITPPNVTNGHTSTTTRTHGDGARIRTETFSYTKGPTIKTTTTTTTKVGGPTLTSSQQISVA